MKRFYIKYTEWEDYKNGMYDSFYHDKKDYLINESISLLSNTDLFHKTMIKMIKEWKISTKVNMTNVDGNRMAWLGQASCCYNHNCPEILTRIAWGRLTDKQRFDANKMAKKIIKKYERENRRIHKAMESQGVLF